MTQWTIRWTKRALRRLDQIGTYISDHNPEAAARVVMRIAKAVDSLTAQPTRGRIGRIQPTRELVLTDIPYIIAYRIQGRDVEILTIMHTSQEWPKSL